MIFGLPEAEHVSVEQNTKTVIDILHELKFNFETHDIKIHRLGRFVLSNSRPRPIKIILQTEDDAVNLIRSSKTLKNSVRFKHCFISSDKTSRQINLYKELKLQLTQRMNNGETDLKIRYINDIPKIVHLN